MTRSIRDTLFTPQRTSTAWTVEPAIPSRPAICARPSLSRHRNEMMRFLTCSGVWCGLLDRACIPADPSAR